ncbi:MULTISPECIES: hypothetical protein [Hwangdonia]|uniref:Uncharacterized protein n=1 Tax=Hwangdonia seohaensis TaxID=1240727 RepID=A0ABW3RDN9_9FLAO|nr:hypothetical protein [Hwangdonia seohaensis]
MIYFIIIFKNVSHLRFKPLKITVADSGLWQIKQDYFFGRSLRFIPTRLDTETSSVQETLQETLRSGFTLQVLAPKKGRCGLFAAIPNADNVPIENYLSLQGAFATW